MKACSRRWPTCSVRRKEAEVGLTDEHYNIVKERYEEYKRGEGRSYTWEETKAMIRAGKGKEA
jgi:hypothetical protein